MEAFEEDRDAFNEVNEGVTACTDAKSRLASIRMNDFSNCSLVEKGGTIRTERRTSMPTNIALVG